MKSREEESEILEPIQRKRLHVNADKIALNWTWKSWREKRKFKFQLREFPIITNFVQSYAFWMIKPLRSSLLFFQFMNFF